MEESWVVVEMTEKEKVNEQEPVDDKEEDKKQDEPGWSGQQWCKYV